MPGSFHRRSRIVDVQLVWQPTQCPPTQRCWPIIDSNDARTETPIQNEPAMVSDGGNVTRVAESSVDQSTFILCKTQIRPDIRGRSAAITFRAKSDWEPPAGIGPTLGISQPERDNAQW